MCATLPNRARCTTSRAPDGRSHRDRERLSTVHPDRIMTLAAQRKLPAIYFQRVFVSDGGLVSYGPDMVDQFRRAASYVDRFSKARSRPTCRCSSRPSSSW